MLNYFIIQYYKSVKGTNHRKKIYYFDPSIFFVVTIPKKNAGIFIPAFLLLNILLKLYLLEKLQNGLRLSIRLCKHRCGSLCQNLVPDKG